MTALALVKSNDSNDKLCEIARFSIMFKINLEIACDKN